MNLSWVFLHSSNLDISGHRQENIDLEKLLRLPHLTEEFLLFVPTLSVISAEKSKK